MQPLKFITDLDIQALVDNQCTGPEAAEMLQSVMASAKASARYNQLMQQKQLLVACFRELGFNS